AGIVPDVVPADRLQTANGLLGLGANSARIAGLLLSGGAVVMFGGGAALVVSAVLFGTAGSIVAALRLTKAQRDAAAKHSVLADLRVGWREFSSRQWLWVVVAQFSILIMALQAAHGVLGPVVAKRYLGGAPAWSAVLAGEAFGTIVGVIIALRLRPRRPLLLATLVTFPTAFPYLLLGLGTPLWTIVTGAFLMGVSFDIFGVMWNTTMQREIPPEALSRVTSYDALGSLMFGPIGLLLAGPATVVVGPRPALLGCAALIVLTTCAALLSPSVRELRAPEPVHAVSPADALTAAP
ncbi:MAG TPA: MFS transporter, partial [Actinopolymorphaceae bacterium]|nr:MFS transporter [Actinopolymorphaceae bacterium]